MVVGVREAEDGAGLSAKQRRELMAAAGQKRRDRKRAIELARQQLEELQQQAANLAAWLERQR